MLAGSPMSSRTLRPTLLALAVLAGGCAVRPDDPGPVDPQLSACAAELRAFVAVSRLARQHGDDWSLFEPAIEAMKDQVADCVQDAYPTLESI
jgi:hypothetical protein